MDFRILGPLEVEDEGRRVALGGAKQRALLAHLLLHPNEVVSSDVLIAALWGQDGRHGSSKALQIAVSRLRRALEPELADGRESRVLVTRPPGYELKVATGELDLERFEQGVASGREALHAGDAATAARRLREALALWRGPPLADLAYERFPPADAARLDDLRLSATEDRVAADLELGRHAELTGELERLVADHPYRERLWRALMLALYRSGRQADALDVYARMRRVLVEELGIEPSRELKDLQRGILAHDAALELEPPPEAWEGFVGRKREMARLLGALDSSLAGAGATVLVGGEPGIGKSRLAEELAARARERHSRVLVGRCWEAGGAPPYWPWVQVLRAYARDTGEAALSSMVAQAGAELATVLPEIGDLVAHPPPAAGLSPEGARFRLFDSIAAFLRAAAAGAPLTLVLDDLHAADEPSILLLRFVASELADAPILIVGCYRETELGPGHPLAAALPELARAGSFERIALRGLELPETGRLLELTLGEAPPAALAERVQSETEGNPLFAGQIGQLLASQGALDATGDAEGGLPIPDGVREAIGRRLERHSEACRHVLTLASVLGREFDLLALERVAALDQAELFAALEEAAKARLVGELPGAPGRMRFSHVLIRDTLYMELSATERLRLHREVGQALEGLYAGNVDPHLAELAHHYLEAGGSESEKAIAYAARAGDRAASQLGFEEAARSYRSALGVLEATGPGNPEQTCALLLSLGDVLSRAGSAREAKEAFRRAADIAEEAGRPEALAHAALGYGGRFIWGRAGADPAVVVLLERALAAVGREDSPARVRLLARLAAALRDERLRERRLALAEEAVEMARRIGDPETLAYALDGCFTAVEGPDNISERLAGLEELIALGEQIGDKERVYVGHDYRLHTFWTLGDRAGVDLELDNLAALAGELRQPAQRWHVSASRTVHALMEGRFDLAGELIAEAADSGRQGQSWNAAVSQRLALFVLRRAQGRLAEVEGAIERSVHEFPALVRFRCALAHLYGELGREREARAVFDDLMAGDLAHEYLDAEWLFSMNLLPDVCSFLGDGKSAARLFKTLLPYERLYAEAPVEAAFGCMARGLGVLGTMLRRFDDAERQFEGALMMERRMRAAPWLAHVQQDYAAMLFERAGTGDEERARELLAAAVSGYRALGMDTWVRRARALSPRYSAAR